MLIKSASTTASVKREGFDDEESSLLGSLDLIVEVVRVTGGLEVVVPDDLNVLTDELAIELWLVVRIDAGFGLFAIALGGLASRLLF